MSDFLSNLAARSRETVEPIRPRVLSFFERDRRYDGRLRVRQETTEIGTTEEDGVGSPNEQPLAPEAMRSSQPSTVTPQPSSHIDPRKSALTPQSKSLPNLRQVLGNSTVQGEETFLASADNDKSKSRLVELKEIFSHKLNHRQQNQAVDPGLPPRVAYVFETRFHRSRSSVQTPVSAETANSVEWNSNVSFGRSDPKSTETLLTSTMRPMSRPRGEIESTPSTPIPADHASEPSVQVTIGRVEVRAIFPESSVRQTTPRHSKPAISLDDYLKPRNNR
jgi:hypothetical protein